MKSKSGAERRTRMVSGRTREPAWLKAIFDRASVGMAVLDAQGCYLHANPCWLKMTGYSLDEITRATLSDQTHPDDITGSQEKLQGLVSGKIDNYRLERRFLRKDGSIFWGELSAAAQRDTQGNLVAIILILADISERREAEANLWLERDLFTGGPVVVWKQVGRGEEARQYVSSNISQFGYKVEDFTNVKTYFNIVHEEDRQRVRDEIDTHLESGANSYEQEYRIKCADGEIRWVHDFTLVSRNPQGKVTQFGWYIFDVTERKKAEEAQREISLAAEEARATAEAAIRTQSIFLASMSHEIRTPLHGVIGMTSLLLDTELGQEQQDFVNIIRSNSETLLTIINNLLDFSKIEAGKLELEATTFDLRTCIEEILDLMAGKAAEKKIELAYFMAQSVPEVVVGDVTRLRQILVNLLHNAIKFTDEGEVVLEVSLENEQSQQKPPYAGISEAMCTTLHFVVRDTGFGIPEEKMDRLFKPFSQVDISITRKYGGTGLGLAISRQLCELMGGKIWAESEGIPGKGSSFHFTIVVEEGMVEYSSMQYHKQPQLDGKHLLVVADSAINRRILTHFTGLWGAYPKATASARDALNWIHHGEVFDLAILDMQMPEIDGIQFAEVIHKRKEELPLVMLTSLGMRDRQVPVDLFAGRLNKPIKVAQLFEVLTSVLSIQPTMAAKHIPARPRLDAQMAEKRPLKILLAEDNPINQQVVKLMLSKLGYKPEVVSNGLETLNAVKQHDYDLVLMDVQMPEMNGEEATRRIRAEVPQKRQPYIVALTADALEGRREFYLEIGMDDYLSKPMGIDNLVKAIEHYWAVRELAASSARTPAVIAVETLNKNVIQREIVNEWIQAIGSQSSYLSVIDVFLDDSPHMVHDIERFYAARDWKSLNAVTHALRSSSGSMGANQLSNLLGILEDLSGVARDGGAIDENLLPGLYNQIQQLHSRACEELRSLQAELITIAPADSQPGRLKGTSDETIS
ncbi:MAG: response regulator [Anaerolineaceae bacterium]